MVSANHFRQSFSTTILTLRQTTVAALLLRSHSESLLPKSANQALNHPRNQQYNNTHIRNQASLQKRGSRRSRSSIQGPPSRDRAKHPNSQESRGKGKKKRSLLGKLIYQAIGVQGTSPGKQCKVKNDQLRDLVAERCVAVQLPSAPKEPRLKKIDLGRCPGVCRESVGAVLMTSNNFSSMHWEDRESAYLVFSSSLRSSDEM